MGDIDLHPLGSERFRSSRSHPFTTSTFFSSNSKRRRVLEPYKCIDGLLEPYKCLSCRTLTPFLAQLKTHSLTQIPIYRQKNETVCYVCESCNFKTYSRLILLNHIYSSRCKVTDKNSVLMLMKLVDKSGETTIKLYCSEGIPRTLHHVQRPARQPPGVPSLIPCHLCEFKTKDRNYLKTHVLRRHTPPEAITWHQCAMCLYVAKFKGDLNRHIIHKHTPTVKKEVVRCKFCRSRFKTQQGLETHVSERHSSKEVVTWYRCDECPHKTRYKEHFRRHKREQHAPVEDQKQLLCEHCGYKAKQKIHLKLHVIQRHTDDKDIEWYKCGECEYKAKLKASLKDHVLRKHETGDIKWFKCDDCEYKTFKRYLLKTHSRVLYHSCDTMNRLELTFAILKPHVIKQPLAVEKIRNIILTSNFKVVKSKRHTIQLHEAESFYHEHKTKFFYKRLVTFMTSGPSDFYILAREDAIKTWRQLMGPTKVFKTQFEAPDSIRGQFGLSDTRNATHGSGSIIFILTNHR
ncbi:hypothetical protein TcasGA2_TC034003 [Tribolium castaneum]|uniref:C2H2-type domain-containing protein n=1 Tax=Tribolium castaneum TaxID=7070 RepID=A0A139WE78_TRICA|nr:hypothetical protein TcasGA2_TC034003 [Tribolium castaneum]